MIHTWIRGRSGDIYIYVDGSGMEDYIGATAVYLTDRHIKARPAYEDIRFRSVPSGRQLRLLRPGGINLVGYDKCCSGIMGERSKSCTARRPWSIAYAYTYILNDDDTAIA